MNYPAHLSGRTTVLPLVGLLLLGWICVGDSRAAKGNKEERSAWSNEADWPKAKKRDDKGAGGDGSRPTSVDLQARVMTKLRERLNVPDEAEWEIISERITKVEESRRFLAVVNAGGRGGLLIVEKAKRSTKTAKSAHPEQDALRSALGSKLPDAEIDARLARVREVYQQNEFRLARAQADLRAVLSVRQEAEAVLAGLLPP